MEQGKVIIDTGKCIGCGVCAKVGDETRQIYKCSREPNKNAVTRKVG